MRTRQIRVNGLVQGVGFRYTCKNLARGFDVVGSVRNLDDGRVELRCGGEVEEVEAFLAAIAESDLKAHIKNATTLPLAPLTGVRGFEITQ